MPDPFLSKSIQLVRRAIRSRRLEANAFFLWATAITGTGAGFLFWNLAARFYPTEDVGTASSVISLMLLVSGITSLGVGIGLVRYLDSALNRVTLINSALTLTLLTSLVFGMVCVWGIGIWSPGLAILRRPEYFFSFLILLASTTHNALFLMIFLSLKRSSASWALALLLNAVRLGMLIFLRIDGSLGIVISLAAATLPANFLATILLYRLEHDFRPGLALSGSALRMLIPYSFVSGMADFLARVPAMVAPLFALEFLGAIHSAHVYIAWMMGALLLSPGISMAQSAFSESASRPAGMHAAIRHSIRLSLIITSVLAVCLFFFSDFLLSLFGEEYRSAGVLLRWLCVAAPMYAVSIVIMSSFRVQNRLGILLLLNVAVMVVFSIPQFFFLRSAGLPMMGIAWVIAQGIALLIAWAGSRWKSRQIASETKSPAGQIEPKLTDI